MDGSCVGCMVLVYCGPGYCGRKVGEYYRGAGGSREAPNGFSMAPMWVWTDKKRENRTK